MSSDSGKNMADTLVGFLAALYVKTNHEYIEEWVNTRGMNQLIKETVEPLPPEAQEAMLGLLNDPVFRETIGGAVVEAMVNSAREQTVKGCFGTIMEGMK